jgi:hypothetical protein
MSQLKKAFKKGIVLGVKDVTFEKDKLYSACQAGEKVPNSGSRNAHHQAKQ